MPLYKEIIHNICGYSQAKYATWFYYKPDNLLFDVGEGVSISLRNKIYAVDSICISHGHGDHIAGLPGLLNSRASSMGDRHKPLTIYYPLGDCNIAKLRRYIEDTVNTLPFPLHWIQLRASSKVALSANRYLLTFASKHHLNNLTLGYKIVEKRMRLKKEYRELPQAQLLKLIKQQGKDALSETYSHILLCFSGDSMPLDIELVNGAEVLLHDATFLQAKDREEETHASLEEVLQMAKAANISALALFHFSARYRHQEILKAIRHNIRLLQIEFPVFCLLPHSHPFSFKKISLDCNNF